MRWLMCAARALFCTGGCSKIHVRGAKTLCQASWTNLMAEHAKHGRGKEGLIIYKRMREEGVLPRSHTFVAALKACSSLADLESGKQIHGHVVESGYESDLFVATTLIYMYAKCGSISSARSVFERMPLRTIVPWNAIIIAYTQSSMAHFALQLYARLQLEGFIPDDRTFAAAIKACSILASQHAVTDIDCDHMTHRSLLQGRSIHSQVVHSGLASDVFLSNALIDMYAKCGSISEARDLFDKMLRRNMVSWNVMIMAYVQLEMGQPALELYQCMQNQGFTPDAYTFVAALTACASLGSFAGQKSWCLEMGRFIHSEVAKSGLESQVFVANTLIDMYAKCRSIVDARQVFEMMPCHDVVSWTAMIMAYAQIEMGDSALQLYARMQNEGFQPNDRTFVAALKACGSLATQQAGDEVDSRFSCLEQGRCIHAQIVKCGLESDTFVANTLMDMYAKCGSMVEARCVFERMTHHSLVSWNAMIMGYAQMEMGGLALQLYTRMQSEGFSPDAHTFVAALKACSSVASLENGKEVHNQICRVGLENDVFVMNCLIDMYGKCGSMIDAQGLFDALPARDLVAWNALIAGYSGQGDSECVFNSFNRMQQEAMQPNRITFLSILSVCSHTGLVDKGQKYFQDMRSKYQIKPDTEHYCCMIDLLGRARQLDEAVAMVKKIPFIPNQVTWMSVLDACRKWNDMEMCNYAFECALVMDEKHPATYVLITNVHDSAHTWHTRA